MFWSDINSFKFKTFFYAFAVLIERLISFLIIPIITKNTEQSVYGVWTQIMVTCSFLMGIILLGFSTSLVKFLAGKTDAVAKSRLINGMLLISFLIWVIVGVIILLAKASWAKLIFGDIQFVQYIYILLVFLLTEASFDLFTSFIRAENLIIRLSCYYLIKNVLRVMTLGIGIAFLKWSFSNTMWLMFGFQFALMLWIYCFEILRKYGVVVHFIRNEWKTILAFSLPLVPFGILIWANCYTSRYFILHYLNLNELSRYALTYSLTAIGGLFYAILGFTLYPHLASLFNQSRKEEASRLFYKSLDFYIAFSLPFVIWISLLNRPIVEILSTSAYITSINLFILNALAVVFFGIYSLFMYITVIEGKTVFNLKVALIGFLVNLFLSFIFVKYWGIMGAAFANLVSNLFLATMTVLEGKKYLISKYSLKGTAHIFLNNMIFFLFIFGCTILITHINIISLITITIVGGALYFAADVLLGKSLFLELVKR
jgi:O-antigen/teichoic acid export membrane protein